MQHSLLKELRYLLILPLLFFSVAGAWAQGIIVQGKVTDDSGVALPGVTVILKGTSIAAPTNIDGTFSIKVPDGSGTLVFSYLGFKPQEVSINSRSVINVTLAADSKALEEIVVVGYGEQKKATLTGAVSTIDTEELVQSPVANISNSLVGRLPGLVAVQSSGEPGFDQSSIRIRGIGTLNAGAESDPLILVDGVQRSSMNQIDPNEVESISILKDASATAVFGVRGANGVILITTKTGISGKAQISYTSNFGFQNPTQLPEMLNSYEYAMLRNEASMNSGQELYFSEQDLEQYKNGSDPYFHPDVDWFDLILKDYSLQQQHNFNIRGGSDDTRYFISLGYFDQNGAYDVQDVQTAYSANPKYKRYNLRSNFDIDITKNFSAAIKLGGQFTDSNYPGYGAGEIFFRILGSNPLGNPGILDGKLISGVEGLPNSGSPLSVIANSGYQRNFSSTLNTSLSLQHKLDFITQGLKVRGMVAYDNYYQHSVKRGKASTTYQIVKDPNEPSKPVFIQQGDDAPFSFSEGYGRNRKIYTEGAVDYARSFGSHNISALALYMQEKYTAPGQEYNVPRGYQGLVGRVTYNYKERYLTEFNMGYNGSENFPEEKRFGFFPSLSLGWILTEEPFIPKNNLLTFFKIRGSYGEVGNDKIGGARFLYLPSVFYPNSGGYYFGDYNSGSYQHYAGAQEGRIGNPDVMWERAKKSNIGFETGFFKDKLRISADFFMEKRDNILWYLGTIPALVQAELPPVNIGEVENKGYEFDASFNDNLGGQFNYWIKGNYSLAKNEIKYMDEPNRPYPWLQRTGHPVGQYWGLVNKGFYNTAEDLVDAPSSAFTSEIQLGDIKYVDQNKDGVIDQNDEVPIGYSNFPQVVYGMSFGGDFKGFDFSVLFQGAERVSTYLDEIAAWAFETDWGNATTRHLERWTPERYAAGEPITYPRIELSALQNKHNYRPSDFWLQDASYLRLKNVEIAYRFRGGILNKVGASSLRIFANGNNLLTWSKMKTYDPEAPAGRGQFYPQMRVYNFGVNLQF